MELLKSILVKIDTWYKPQLNSHQWEKNWLRWHQQTGYLISNWLYFYKIVSYISNWLFFKTMSLGCGQNLCNSQFQLFRCLIWLNVLRRKFLESLGNYWVLWLLSLSSSLWSFVLDKIILDSIRQKKARLLSTTQLSSDIIILKSIFQKFYWRKSDIFINKLRYNFLMNFIAARKFVTNNVLKSHYWL